ncbi:hypothetical protein ACFYP4_16060 [Streptomyces sp. NPDC005551]
MPEAYVFTRYGGPETEALAGRERPVPGPRGIHARGETVIEVAA